MLYDDSLTFWLVSRNSVSEEQVISTLFIFYFILFTNFIYRSPSCPHCTFKLALITTIKLFQDLPRNTGLYKVMQG